MFFKYFASKNQLPGLSINGALVENGLIKFCVKFTEFCVKLIDQSENLSLWYNDLNERIKRLSFLEKQNKTKQKLDIS